MKRAKLTIKLGLKQRPPRNPVAQSPLLKKGSTHQRKDKRASRARQKAHALRGLDD